MAEHTLGSLKSEDMSLTLYCYHRDSNGVPCYHSTTVPIDEMIARFGPDMPVGELIRRSKCKKCGKGPPTELTCTPNKTGGYYR